MNYSFKIYLVLSVLTVSTMVAQQKDVEKGDKDFYNLSYIEAIQHYLKATEAGDFSEETLRKLGDSYYYNADYANAAIWYGKLFDFAESTDAEYLYRYAQSLKSTQQYAASNEIMEKLNKAKPVDERASLYVNERNYLKEIEQNSGRFKLTNLAVNSSLSDFAPSLYGAHLVFASNRGKNWTSKRIHEWNDEPFLDLYVTSMSDTSATSVEKFSKEINTRYHESTAVFTRDKQTVYFTRNNYTDSDFKKDSDGINRLKLYRATKKDDVWNVTELPFNSDQYSVAHPALSPDGKTLYFASDMPGSLGMSDLYRVAILADGFGTPEPLGSTINTEGRETFPFISEKGHLYYASDGQVGLGGLDVFVSEANAQGNFGESYNVGAPVNTPKDDFSFVIDETTNTGYLASNREGGRGGDDIYSLVQLKPLVKLCQQELTGTVRDQKSKEVLGGATITLLDANGAEVGQVVADEKGMFAFGKIPCETSYTIRSEKKEYSAAEKALVTSKEVHAVTNETLYMAPVVTVVITEDQIGEDLFVLLGLNPINFDLNKSNIRPDAAAELQKVIGYMKQYPTVKVDVRSHTDSRGSDAYNENLSDRRAKSTVNYLVRNGGIDASRLNGKGFGESQLKNRCRNGVQCSKAEHEQNRRSEFIIVAK